MPERRPPEIRLADLVQKKQQLDAQIEALNHRSGRERRQVENRAIWLLGRLLRDEIAEDPALRERVRQKLRERLTERDWSRGVWDILFPEDAGKTQ